MGAEAMDDGRIVFDNISKFYGEVLGVNRVHLSIPSGITGFSYGPFTGNLRTPVQISPKFKKSLVVVEFR